MISFYLGQLDKWILPLLVHEHVGKRAFADLALKLAPINACVVWRDLPVLLSLEPALQANVVDKLNASTTCANLQEGIYFIKLVVPAQPALRCRVALLRLRAHWILLLDNWKCFTDLPGEVLTSFWIIIAILFLFAMLV
jgi:hypothetical protein